MIDQQYAETSDSVVINVLGILRWAAPSEQGGWDVEETFHNGTIYMAYSTFNGKVVWDVRERGGYPDKKEWAELEAAAQY